MTAPLHLDLFSGVAGFSIASNALGWQTAAFVEIDPFCQKVLTKNFPEVPIHGDITTISAADIDRWTGGRPVDLITGGFPCQPVSVAGQRRGSADDRWLWPAMRRVIALAQPRVIVGENTAGLISMGLDGVLADLEADGYAAWPVVVPALAVGALHRRDRVWIIAYADHRFSERSVDTVCAGWDAAGGSGQATSDADGGGSQYRPRVNDAGQPDALGCGAGQVAWRSSHPDLWSRREADGHALAGVRRVVDGLPGLVDRPEPARLTNRRDGRSSRLKALGNAIVPQVAYEILRPIAPKQEAA